MRSKAEALARRICREVARQQAGRPMLWISVDELSVTGRSRNIVDSALELAAQRGWLMVGGQPAHSLMLTEAGRQVADRASK